MFSTSPATRALPPRLIAACIAALVLGLAGRHVVLANTDVSWLLTLDEKWLGGAVPYVDIVETNPPMSLYLYMPAAALGRWLAAPPEPILDAMVFALGCLSAAWTLARVPLGAMGLAGARAIIAFGTLAAVFILPAFCFGQREHFALIFFLPWLAVALRRAHGLTVDAAGWMTAGAAAGLVMAIKPHFALPILAASCAASCCNSRARPDWRVILAPENFVAGSVFAAYLGIALLAHPAYWTGMAPLLRLVYLPVRVPVWRLIFGDFPVFALEMAGIAGLLARTRGRAMLAPWIVTMTAAIAGFLAAAIIQSKGFPYHFLPAFGLIVILLACLGARGASEHRPDLLVLAFALAFFAQAWRWCDIGIDMAPLRDRVAAVENYPRIMSLSSEPTAGFPLTREAGGEWVDRAQSRWVTYYAAGLAGADGFDPAQLPALRAAVEKDRRGFAADLRANHPNIILVERKPFDFLAWARRDAEISALLACFHDAGHTSIGDPDSPGGQGIAIEVWAVNAPAAPGSGGPGLPACAF